MDWIAIGQVFVDSFLQFDFLIFVAAAANYLVFYRKTRRHVVSAENTAMLTVYDKSIKKKDGARLLELTEDDVRKMSEEVRMTNKWYSYFVNITSIFPLLGILGTVFSLINLVGGDAEITQQSFFVALTSTGWGVVFSMIFKVLFDARISPRIEKNNEDVARKKKQFEME